MPSRSMEVVMRKLVVAALLSLSLAACAQPGSNQWGISKQTGGALLGGAGGALAGAQFGQGKGQLAATAAGTLLGAWLGSEAGSSLDRADQAYAQRGPYSYGPPSYVAPSYGYAPRAQGYYGTGPSGYGYAPPPAYYGGGYGGWGGGWQGGYEPPGYATVPPRY